MSHVFVRRAEGERGASVVTGMNVLFLCQLVLPFPTAPEGSICCSLAVGPSAVEVMMRWEILWDVSAMSVTQANHYKRWWLLLLFG